MSNVNVSGVLKVLTIVGARPQFVKAAAVSRALRRMDGVREILLHTGQHYDDNMSGVFFDELEIPPPDHQLGIGSGSHGAQTGQMIEAIEVVLVAEKPDCVVVYGDTNSTLAGAIATAKLHIPLAHVEAGLRSFNRLMPEELNRVLSDHAADALFAPTEGAVENLRREGIPDTRVLHVGDVMFDVALYFSAKADSASHVLRRLGLRTKEYVLATIHRAENTDDAQRLAAILGGMTLVATDIPVLMPMHPRTRAVLESDPRLKDAAQRVTVIDPVGYLDMMMLEKNARLIATDSGGIQKEAFFHRVPCVTLRSETEWSELVDLGWNRLAEPTDACTVSEVLRKGLNGSEGRDATPYGDGNAASRIALALPQVAARGAACAS